MKNDIRDLQLVLDARVRLIAIESWDELRVLETLTSVAIHRGTNLMVWSITEGLHRMDFGGAMVEGTETLEGALRFARADLHDGLYVLFDVHPFLRDDPLVVRLIKEIAIAEGARRPTLVLVSHALKLPAEVQRYAARFNLSLPSEDANIIISFS